MARRSNGELVFAEQLKGEQIEYKEEFRFCNKRAWRADFAIVSVKILIEIEGGVYSRGRHVRPSGFIKDCEKYNTAALLGWRVFRFPTHEVFNNTAIEFLKKALNNEI